LSYNFIQPGENISFFDKDSVFRGPRASSLEKRAADRVKALPIRRKALAFSAQGSTARTNNTILSFSKRRGPTMLLTITFQASRDVLGL